LGHINVPALMYSPQFAIPEQVGVDED